MQPATSAQAGPSGYARQSGGAHLVVGGGGGAVVGVVLDDGGVVEETQFVEGLGVARAGGMVWGWGAWPASFNNGGAISIH